MNRNSFFSLTNVTNSHPLFCRFLFFLHLKSIRWTTTTARRLKGKARERAVEATPKWAYFKRKKEESILIRIRSLALGDSLHLFHEINGLNNCLKCGDVIVRKGMLVYRSFSIVNTDPFVWYLFLWARSTAWAINKPISQTERTWWLMRK